MNYYDLVKTEELSKQAQSLGYKQAFSENQATLLTSGKYDDLVKKTKKGTLLLDPVTETRTLVDPVLAKRIAEKNAGVVLTLNGITGRNGMKRAGWLRSLMLTVNVCKKHGAEIMIATNAQKTEQLRTPLMLEATGETLGLTKPQARWACTTSWEKVLK